ncbi:MULTISPECIES: CCA tRNA nucleotidyltransferase [unclassified Campylobacter]|uniref:CCA tRNA nucleotidyltransferase n=1 Tax=unclassified Campylobacter TaxID=2593542 RepID=UPI0022E9A5DC|nr:MULTISPECIES: CCA tRNA nucleotidyltransferase [unclassified Campylobacter]MDA3061940.1 CCA tRNA nucleotidyltransferase [Campylobacter sp. JMF_14 EL1]MDA3072955.1 CCA tRNA nucleotidyltransferase [Campylobacter sp. JMF_10 EL2]
MKIYQNSDFIAIFDLLKKYTKRVYFVGGFVRDFFLGRESGDIDIEVYDINPQKFSEIMGELGALGTGKQFFVYKFHNFDIALPRTENKVGVGHKAFEVALANDEKIGARRRDFTINSMMINIFSGEVLDFYGGLNDLKARILRVVDEKSFVEDSLRVYRGVQFAARFGFDIEPKSLELMRQIDTSDLSVERICAELIKLFRAKFQGLGLKILHDLGLFEKIFGVQISRERCAKIANFIDNGRKFVSDEAFFLYAVLNLLNLDKKQILENLKLNSHFKRIINEPFYKKIDNEKLMQISLQMPINSWLGAYNQTRINRAKALGVYEQKFISKVKSEAVINDGFKGKEIAVEIARRQRDEIRKFLDDKNAF